jgi:methyl-accepting chemotaxis protein
MQNEAGPQLCAGRRLCRASWFDRSRNNKRENIDNMENTSLQKLIMISAGVIALFFVKLMSDMSDSMEEMTGSIRAIAQDVSEMQRDMHNMNESMARMERSIQGFGQAFSPAGQQFQQMNPNDMMQQVWPSRGQQSR